MEKIVISREYMSDGNNSEEIEGGAFAVLEFTCEDRVIGRYVGRKGQKFAELRKQAKELGLYNDGPV